MAKAPPILDGVALTASFLCLIHCLALPLAIATLPALTDILAVPEAFHMWMLAFALPTSAFAVWLGWRRHGRIIPLMLAVIGLVSMSYGALAAATAPSEIAFTTLGGLILSWGHVRNWRYRSLARCHDRP